jgi:ankyrin repeat protein
MSEMMGSISIKDSFENGLKLAEGLAARKLDSALSSENEITLLACTLAIFQNNLPVMKIDRSASLNVPELDDSNHRRSLSQMDPPDFDNIHVERESIKRRDPSTGGGDIVWPKLQPREPAQSDPEPSSSDAGSNDDNGFEEGHICRPSTFVPPTPGKVKTSNDPFFLDNLDESDLYNPKLGIFVAISNGNMDDLEYELKQSAELDLTNFFDSRGRNPIEFAAVMGNLDIIDMLEGCGCRFVSVSRAFLRGYARRKAAQS